MSSLQSTCPSCGAPIEFHLAVSLMTTCVHCGSTVVRHDLNVELLGKEAIVMQDMSPFQTGTTGVYEGRSFMLMGRIKLMYDFGTWSEWYAYFGNNEGGWLAEAQGLYMMSFEAENPPARQTSYKPGQRIMIGGTEYTVDDVRSVTYIGTEGELPFIFEKGFEALSIDLSAPGDLFANISISGDDYHVYLGKYAEFDSFGFKNLREIHGWELK